ncbi:cadherin-like beta sandwich domain-containing protein, partial [Romboutsia ilealis]|uniref:cadherin-like beta sandwich domain-containing protein n=1 Tax=Romboutsia ilealis TaxID=1115758 RepID=UPI00257355D8
YIIYVNKEMSTNNYLSSLTSSLGDLMPEFDPTILEYIVEVPRETEKIIINATTQDKSANITSGLGEHSLVLGNNIVFIKVKSAIGFTRTYKVNVIIKADDNNYLQNLKVMYLNEEILINPEFNKDINEYDVTVNSDFNFVQIKADAINENATITGTGIKELKTGLNKYEIVVTEENESINTYILNMTKEVSSNNYLVNLIPSSGSLNPKFNKDILEYTLDLGYETSELEFNAIVESNLAHVTGVESKVVSEGLSTREIIVTAEDGSVRTYKINVNKETAAEARLESLEIEGYLVEFNPDTYSYNLSVSISKKELLESEIKAIPKDPEATVNLMGDLTINEGMINIYVIEVIAKDGYTTETYTLNITRDSAEYSLRSNKYEIVRNEEEDYVIGIQPSTIISDFKNNFENEPEDLKVYLETSEVADTELTATALILKLEKNGYIYDTLRVIVRGDLTKDGKVNITDQVKMINFVGRTTTFDKYQMLAGDLTFDGKVNITDQVKIINYVGRTISDINNKPTS